MRTSIFACFHCTPARNALQQEFDPPTNVHFTSDAFDSTLSLPPAIMSRFIRAILFDFGGTLMYARDEWSPIEARADLAFAKSLYAQGMDIDPVEFALRFRQRLREYYIRREESLFETTYFSVAKELIQEQGSSSIAEAGIRSALDAMFAITQTNWILEEDTRPTLTQLKNDGYRLGLVSNAGDNRDVFQLADKFKIEEFFDFILTSAACSYRKPHTRIFELAAAHWSIAPSEIAMVGDMLEADVLGAQNAGLFSIWITRRANPKSDDLHRIKPDLSLPTLAEIPAALDRIR